MYIATSNVQAPVTSPFSYSDKVDMMTRLGVPPGHIVQVRNPYQAREIYDNIPDRDDTALIYAVSEKDMQADGARFKFGTKKNGEPSYMQPMPESLKQLKPLTQHAYVAVTPTVNFRVQGADANSASQIRKAYVAAARLIVTQSLLIFTVKFILNCVIYLMPDWALTKRYKA